MSTYHESSDTELAGSECSISTENGNKYCNQLHYYDAYGWPAGWEGQAPTSSSRLSVVEDFPVDNAVSRSSDVEDHTRQVRF